MAKDYTSIRVDKDAKQAAAAAKKDGETWDEYVQRCAENPPVVKEFVEAGGLDTETAEKLNDAVQTVEQRTGRIEKLLEDLQR
jgi:hypothetical protein